MTESHGERSCPGCGARVGTQFCPHCGTRVEQVAGRAFAPLDDAEAPTLPAIPVVPVADGPARAVPEMFPTEMVPTAGPGAPQAWSQAPEAGSPPGPATGLFPGWTGMYPAVATQGASGVLAPRPERRRRALYAVLGIAAATAVVLLTALLIAPHWGGAGNTADKTGQPVAVSSAAVTGTPTPSDSPPPTTAPSTAVLAGPPATTVTVTTGPVGTTTGAGRPTGTGRSPVPATTPKPAPRTTPKATPKPSSRPTPRATPKPTPTPSQPLGVPQRNISCSAGYIVQLASELDTKTFAARVAGLKASGRVPAGSLAADSTKSCDIFSSQINAVVLYSGPYSTRYGGCAARLAGPADAYIKGGSAAHAKDYISCLCPARAAGLPRYTAVGQQGVWIGELQRVLGNKLNISVSDLSGNWGTFTQGTRAAVRAFQQAAKLPITGAVDGRTWRALQSAEC